MQLDASDNDDTVNAYITHDDRPNVSSATSRHGAKRGARLHGVTKGGGRKGAVDPEY